MKFFRFVVISHKSNDPGGHYVFLKHSFLAENYAHPTNFINLGTNLKTISPSPCLLVSPSATTDEFEFDIEQLRRSPVLRLPANPSSLTRSLAVRKLRHREE